MASGLFLCRPQSNKNKSKVSAYSFLTLVKHNKNNFTRREVKQADKARMLYQSLGYPGYKKYFKIVESNYLLNCPVNVDDIKRALHICGPDVAHVKGKTVRRRPQPLNRVGNIQIPATIMEYHSSIQLSGDYLFVQGIPFLHAIS